MASPKSVVVVYRSHSFKRKMNSLFLFNLASFNGLQMLPHSIPNILNLIVANTEKMVDYWNYLRLRGINHKL